MKRLTGVLCLILMLSLLCGCGSITKTVTCMELSLEIPVEGIDLSSQDYAQELDLLYGVGNVAVVAVHEPKATLEGYIEGLSLEQYGELVIQMHELDSGLIQKDGLWTFSYEADNAGEMFTYITAVYESDVNFWTVQAYCPTAEYEQHRSAMWEIVSSAKIN